MVSLRSGANIGKKYTSSQIKSNRKKALIGTAIIGGVGAGAMYAMSNMGNNSSSNSSSESNGSSSGGTGADDGSGSSGSGSSGSGVDHSTSNKIADLLGRTSEENPGYVLHLGEILDTYYYANLEELSFEGDYKEISESGTIKLGDVNRKRFYKGIRLKILSNWKEPSYEMTWEKLVEVLLGFITEQTYHEEDTELKISGMSKTLEQKYKFKFTDMKRSEIIREVILTAGMVPAIDVEGLEDDVTSFNNVSSSGGSKDTDSGLAGGEGETIDNLVAKICKGVTGDLAKCKAIHSWLQKNVNYSLYNCSHYDTPEKCLKNKRHLNCADTARLTRAMMSSAGLKAYVVGRSFDGGHFWTIIEIGGKKYASDQTGDGSAFNTVWKASGRTTVSDGGKYSSKNGKNPSC